MTMKFHRFLLLALLPITAMFAACNHDEGETMLELHAERFGGQKLAVQDSTGAWSEGDLVWINGQNYRISIDNNGHAVVSVPTAPSYNAVFPAYINLGGNRVCLPAEYEYATDDSGRQIINLPMAASSDGSNGLFFNHLTGAIIVKFINNRSETVVLDRISVHSANPLCGTFDIGDENTLTTAGTTDTTVTIYFTKHEVLMAHADTIAVLVPVAPAGGDNQFSVEVSCHVDGNRYTARNRQSSPHAFQRNMLGYAYMTVEASTAANWLFEYKNQYLHVKTAQDFVLMQQAINNRWTNMGSNHYESSSYIIDTNIDMAGYEIEPITGFSGSRFNGNGKTISNITINSTSENCALFDTIKASTGTIENINLYNVTLNCNGNTSTLNISPFISRLSGDHTINHCTTHIKNININGTVTGYIYFGGIAAQISNNLNLNNCCFSGNDTIVSNSRIYYGGFIGIANDNNAYTVTSTYCKLNNCIFRLEASNGIFAGGIIGDSRKTSNTTKNCNLQLSLTTSTTSGYIRAGGLVGNLSSDNTTKLTVDNDTLSGAIMLIGNPNNNIGILYGRGKNPRNGYSIGNYYYPNFVIPNMSNNLGGNYW